MRTQVMVDDVAAVVIMLSPPPPQWRKPRAPPPPQLAAPAACSNAAANTAGAKAARDALAAVPYQNFFRHLAQVRDSSGCWVLAAGSDSNVPSAGRPSGWR